MLAQFDPPLTKEENKRFVYLYRVWARIYFADYITKKAEKEQIRKNTIIGIYIPVFDLIAVNERVTHKELELKFHDVDSVINQLKDGYLIRAEGKSQYKLNPSFLENIQPIVGRMVKILEEQIQSYDQKGNNQKLICTRCKKEVDPMYKQLGLKGRAMECSNCHSTDIREQIIDPDQISKCKDLLKKINTWLQIKRQIQQEITRERESLKKKEKEMIQEKVAKSLFQDLVDKIPKKKMIGDREEKVVMDYYDKDYVQTDYVMKGIMKEGLWIQKLKKVRENRRD